MAKYDIQKFEKPEDLEKFIITTDDAMGEEGASVRGGDRRALQRDASRLFYQPARFLQSQTNLIAGYTDAALEIKKYSNFSAGVFSGDIDWRSENPLTKGGFANFRTAPSQREIDLSDFAGLEMRVKTDGRPCVVERERRRRRRRRRRWRWRWRWRWR